MLIENNSDLVKYSQLITLDNEESVEAIHLINGQILVLAANGLSIYKDLASISDPLANGLLHSAALAKENFLVSEEGRYMQMNRSGLIGLFDEKVVLITPNAIQLFPSRESALRNQGELISFHLG
jgi:hypothetical protein